VLLSIELFALFVRPICKHLYSSISRAAACPTCSKQSTLCLVHNGLFYLNT